MTDIFIIISGEFQGEYKSISDFPDPSLGSLNVSTHPTSPIITCSGRARDWPESRGIYRNKDNTFVVFVNEDDHVQFRCFDKGGNVQGVFDKLIRGIAAFERELKKSGEEFIWDDHLGYIVSDPIYLGTALDVRVRVKLHHLSTVRIGKPAWFASFLVAYGSLIRLDELWGLDIWPSVWKI